MRGISRYLMEVDGGGGGVSGSQSIYLRDEKD